MTLSTFNKQIAQLRKALDSNKELSRSAYKRGVREYAFELLDQYSAQQQYNIANGSPVEPLTNAALLNGADGWHQYSFGGCALIYDTDIAGRLCTPSELKRTRGGELNPNSCETWLDVQARALRHASWHIRRTAQELLH